MAKEMFQIEANAVEGKGDEWAVVTTGENQEVVRQFKKESEAQRLCDLLNGAAVLFQKGAKYNTTTGDVTYLPKKDDKPAAVAKGGKKVKAA